MASKRKPLTFTELDNLPPAPPKGKGAILRTPEEIAAEQEQLQVEEIELSDSQETGKPESLSARKPENKETSFIDNAPSIQSNVPPVPVVAEYKKATYRMSEEALEALDDTKRLLRRKYGLKTTLESIVEAAIMETYDDLQENKETSFLVNWFSSKQDNQ